jgi:hypothetical protein
MDEYTVELRIISDDNAYTIEEISSILNLKPDNTRRPGDKQGRTRIITYTMWGYSVYPRKRGRRKKWQSLELALEALLKIFMPLKDKVRKISAKCHVFIYCGYFLPDPFGGIILSPAIIKKLSEFGIELQISAYFCDER